MGVLALTITFAGEILGEVKLGPTILLMAGWIVYLFSIVCGVWGLLALTGSLERGEPAQIGNEADSNAGSDDDVAFPSIYTRNVTLPSILQIGFFLLATLLVVLFAVWATLEKMLLKSGVIYPTV